MVLNKEQSRRRVTDTKALNSRQQTEVQTGCATGESVTEISDKDYRSFCFPCAALEAADDRGKGTEPTSSVTR